MHWKIHHASRTDVKLHAPLPHCPSNFKCIYRALSQVNQLSVVEVKQLSCYATSIHAMFSMVRSVYGRSVVRFNAWTQLCISSVILSSMLPCLSSMACCIATHLFYLHHAWLIHLLTHFERALWLNVWIVPMASHSLLLKLMGMNDFDTLCTYRWLSNNMCALLLP